MEKIINGDCLTEMKQIESGSIDLILTDPPYNIARKNNFHTMGRAGIDFGEWDKDFNESQLSVLQSKTKNGGSIIIFHSFDQYAILKNVFDEMVFKDEIVWEKTNPMPRNRDRRYITDYETAIWCVNKNAKWIFNRQDEAYQRPEFRGSLTPQSEKTEHTTQKPIWLMKDILKIHSNEGDTVLDMFAGSGTTGIACMEMNRKFIMIEKDENYFSILKKRVEEKRKEKDLQAGTLFGEEM